jgi:hypothetical protein
MKKLLQIVAFVTAAGAAAAVLAAGPSFGQVIDGLDPAKNTKLAIKTNWEEFKGREVAWGGVVVEVEGDSKKVKILVADRSRPLYKGYNIEVTTFDVAKAAKLKRGQAVRFKGILDDFDTKKAGAVLEVIEAQIL